MTKAVHSFIATTGSSALADLDTRPHYHSTVPQFIQSTANTLQQHTSIVLHCILGSVCHWGWEEGAFPVQTPQWMNVCWNMGSVMRARPTVAEEQDDVLGLVIPRAEFQRSIQCCSGLSIPIGWFPLKIVQRCSAETHTHTQIESGYGRVWMDMSWSQRFQVRVWYWLLSMCGCALAACAEW